jgi:hypothetical protein
MPRRPRYARRRSRSPLARPAVLIAVPVGLAVVVGAIVAVNHHSATDIGSAANADCLSPAAYVVPASPAGTASSTLAAAGAASPTTASPTTVAPGSPSTAATGTAASTSAASTSAGSTGAATPTTATVPTASQSVAATVPTASASTAASGAAAPTATATAPATTPSTSTSAAPCPSASGTAAAANAATTTATNVNCDIIVPANPLSARGLATPYQLTGPDGMTPEQSGCTMANAANLGAFVQATIVNLQTGQLSVYDPLVITQGTTPAAAPVVPTLPRNYVATIDFGFNGTVLTQVGATATALRQGKCVNGQAGTAFGQVSFCNGTQFFSAAFQLERAGKLRVPSEGTSAKIAPSGGRLGTGRDCPTTRNFDMVDQDPSDNVTTLYLLNPVTGQTAQDTTANEGNLAGATTLANGSDNILVDAFLDPTLGCTPFMAPDLGKNNQPATSQALDELLSAKNQPTIPALVPENDEMTLDGSGQFDAAKTNMYRAEVGQPLISQRNNLADSPAMFCQNMVNIQTPFLAANQALLATGPTPVPSTGDNLFTFMANRLSMSFTNLSCQDFGLTDPVSVTLDSNGVGVAATFNTTPQRVSSTTPTPTATASQSAPATTGPGRGGHRGRHQWMNPSGM